MTRFAALTAWLIVRATDLRDREDGLTTTEWALLTSLAAGIAIIVALIIQQAAQSIANSIPTG